MLYKWFVGDILIVNAEKSSFNITQIKPRVIPSDNPKYNRRRKMRKFRKLPKVFDMADFQQSI
jgi:hypothetical protein